MLLPVIKEVISISLSSVPCHVALAIQFALDGRTGLFYDSGTMIRCYRDYLTYLEADRLALGHKRWTLKAFLLDDVWRFERCMRRLEYLTNCHRVSLRRVWAWWRYRRIGRRLGFLIPINVFGPGLSIAHRGTIVVSDAARIGANCRLHVCVNIGTKAGYTGAAPQIGANCYIAPGAKIFGPITIGDNVVIGANAVVNKSFPKGNLTIGGIPARQISTKTSLDLGSHGCHPASISMPARTP